jgi:hypothetical protein
MAIVAASIYWVIVSIWLVVLTTTCVLYIRNARAFGTTRLLLIVVGIDTLRNIIEILVYFSEGSTVSFRRRLPRSWATLSC